MLLKSVPLRDGVLITRIEYKKWGISALREVNEYRCRVFWQAPYSADQRSDTIDRLHDLFRLLGKVRNKTTK